MRIQDRLLTGKIHHFVQLTLQGLNLIYLRLLLMLETLVFKNLFALFQQVLTHLHGFFKRLVSIFHDLPKGLLIHLDHFLLVFKHSACLLLLLFHPVGLTCHLLSLQLHSTVGVPKLGVLSRILLGSTVPEWALHPTRRRWSSERGRSSAPKGSRATECASICSRR